MLSGVQNYYLVLKQADWRVWKEQEPKTDGQIPLYNSHSGKLHIFQ